MENPAWGVLKALTELMDCGYAVGESVMGENHVDFAYPDRLTHHDSPNLEDYTTRIAFAGKFKKYFVE